jgi:serine-type D-Ala-D-Ala carboxypeptidase
MDFDEVLASEVIDPLGLDVGSARLLGRRHTGWAERVAPTEVVSWRGGVVRASVHDENAWALSGDGASGHAGMFGTAPGVLDLGTCLLDVMRGHRDDFLSPHEIEPLVRPRPGGTLRAGFDGKSLEGSSAGRGFGLSSVGHLGFTGTSMWIDPDAQVVGVLLTNRVHPTRASETIRKVRPIVYDAIWEWAKSCGK